jgi:hypothetical protein
VIALVLGLLFFLISLTRIEFGLYVVIFAMLLSPEVAVGETSQRAITLRIEDFLIAALMIAWVLQYILGVRKYFFRPNPVNLPIYSYLFFALVSTLLGLSFGHIEAKTAALYFLKTCEFFIIFLLTVSCLKDEKTVKRFVFFFLLTGLVIGIYGILQIGQVARVTAPFEGQRSEPNTLGGYLTLLLSMALVLLMYAPRQEKGYKLLAGAVLGVSLVTLLFTLSRASFVGFIFTLLVMGILGKKYFLLYLVIVFVLLSPFLLPDEVWDRVNYTFSGPEKNEILIPGLFSFNVDSSTLERIQVWRKVGYNFIRSPLWGYGLTAHFILDSQFARLLIEVGAIGTALFIWILVRLFKCGWFLLRRSESWYHQALGLGYLAAYCGIIVHSFGTITFYVVRIMEPFWFFTGIVVYLYLEEKKRLAQQSETLAAPEEPGPYKKKEKKDKSLPEPLVEWVP